MLNGKVHCVRPCLCVCVCACGGGMNVVLVDNDDADDDGDEYLSASVNILIPSNTRYTIYIHV